jgi:integrase
LLHVPLRISNLVTLRIGKELTLIKGTGGWQGRILINPEAVKNGIGQEATLTRESVALIRAYLNDFRTHLPNSQTDWLFPGKASPNCPRDKPTFGVAISETIERFVGLRVNPHAFRAFAATMILESNPAALDDVRATLGHSGFNTALKHYRRHETKSAAARLAQHLRLERRLLPAPKATPKKRVIPTFALAGKI